MPRKPKTPPRPLTKAVVCDLPVQNNGRKKKRSVESIWLPIMIEVRKENGRTVKICVHPKARNMLNPLKKMFPDFEFATRAVPVDHGQSYGIWAWLKVRSKEPSVEPPTAGLPPVDPILKEPAFG